MKPNGSDCHSRSQDRSPLFFNRNRKTEGHTYSVRTMTGRFYYFVLVLGIFLVVGSSLSAQTSGKGKEVRMKEIREPILAGTWYPGRSDVLSRDIKRYLDNVGEEKVEGDIVALMSPHAGYEYSGQVAAYAYRLIAGRSFETVVLLAPSHRALFRGASLYDRGGFRTPLGIVPVDEGISRTLMGKRKEIQFLPEAHAQEHSLEIQIPFLQMTLKSFTLVPILLEPYWSWESCQSIASALAETVKGKKVLLIASSDLSHFHSYEKAVELDKIVLDHIERFDPEGLHRDLKGEFVAGPAPDLRVPQFNLKTTIASICPVEHYGGQGSAVEEEGQC